MNASYDENDYKTDNEKATKTTHEIRRSRAEIATYPRLRENELLCEFKSLLRYAVGAAKHAFAWGTNYHQYECRVDTSHKGYSLVGQLADTVNYASRTATFYKNMWLRNQNIFISFPPLNIPQKIEEAVASGSVSKSSSLFENNKKTFRFSAEHKKEDRRQKCNQDKTALQQKLPENSVNTKTSIHGQNTNRRYLLWRTFCSKHVECSVKLLQRQLRWSFLNFPSLKR
jgi:hypothetical protein